MKRLLLSLVCMGVVLSPVLADSLENVRKAPELAFKVPGKPDQLLSQYHGKVVALEFIFTTCPHCQAASKYMTELENELGNRGLQVIAVAVNPNADLLVDNFAKDFAVNFPVGWATQQELMSFMGWTDARFVVPQMVLIDRKGYIHYQTPATTADGNWEKLMNHDAIRQHIEELLNQPATASATSHHTSAAKMASAKKPS